MQKEQKPIKELKFPVLLEEDSGRLAGLLAWWNC